ncbi:MAG: S16 family serine protease [archaeon]|nr:S16 family serine protease [archaeon]
MKKSGIILLIILISLIPSIVAQEGEVYQLKLLAVYEDEDGYTGSDADLLLELREGTGRVFLETFPLTRLDTQISTRFAKEVACNHFKLNCNKYDFIYTIRAKSNIIGGPSAGAALAALTTIAILDLDYDQNIAVTGTINSGGIVGPVGGVKEKLEAAAQAGLGKVLIPKGSSGSSSDISENEDNNSEESELNLVEYAIQNLSLPVEEVLTIDEVVFQLTGEQLNNKPVILEEDEEYQEIMKTVAETLCGRREKIEQEIAKSDVMIDNETNEQLQKRLENSINASYNNDFYSAASYCFGSNIQLKDSFYKEQKPSLSKVEELFTKLQEEVKKTKGEVSKKPIETISDLQTMMIVKERLSDAQQQIDKYLNDPPSSELQDTYSLLAYAEERYFSAVTWMEFFAMDGKKFVFDNQTLQQTCLQKISEAEERYQYAEFFISPTFINGIREKINLAREALDNDEVELCLITASQAKGDSSAILTSFGLNNESVQDVLNEKKHAVERVIAENSNDGVFPILGYSYYKYSSALQEEEQYTALLYLDYALEMSELEVYFPEEKTFRDTVMIGSISKKTLYRLEGFLAAVVIFLLILGLKGSKDRRWW